MTGMNYREKHPVELGTTQRTYVRINITLEGEPAEWFYEWKRRGPVVSTKDAFQAFESKVNEQDLKRSQAHAFAGDT